LEVKAMIRAIVENGAIKALDPLPAEWADGREVVVEEADRASVDDIDEWYRELAALGFRAI